MDEVHNEMGIDMNYENLYKNVHESESNNRVIKDRFRVAYYRYPYVKISRIMIHNLAINAKPNKKVFSTKGGLLAHYIPQMILTQRSWKYNKQLQVAFGAIV